MSAHYIGSIYNLKTGELAPFRSDPGVVWKFVRAVYLKDRGTTTSFEKTCMLCSYVIPAI